MADAIPHEARVLAGPLALGQVVASPKLRAVVVVAAAAAVVISSSSSSSAAAAAVVVVIRTALPLVVPDDAGPEGIAEDQEIGGAGTEVGALVLILQVLDCLFAAQVGGDAGPVDPPFVQGGEARQAPVVVDAAEEVGIALSAKARGQIRPGGQGRGKKEDHQAEERKEPHGAAVEGGLTSDICARPRCVGVSLTPLSLWAEGEGGKEGSSELGRI